MFILKKQLLIYIPFLKCAIQKELAYKFNFYMSILGGVLKILVTYTLWNAIFASSGKSILKGFSINEMTMYVCMSFITYRITSNSIDLEIAGEVKDGSISMNLIKPIEYHIKLLFSSLGKLITNLLFFSVPFWLLIVSYRYIYYKEVLPHISNIFLFLLSTFFSFIILFYINCCFGLISFYTTNILGVNYIKYGILKFLSGDLIPIVFFPLFIQNLLKFTPFTSLNYVPVMIYLNKIDNLDKLKYILLQVIWILILFIINKFFWKRTVKYLIVLGG